MQKLKDQHADNIVTKWFLNTTKEIHCITYSFVAFQ